MKLLERLLLVVGVVLLAYSGYVVTEREISQARDRQALEESREAIRSLPDDVPRDGELVGEIEIPRIGVSAVVRKGADEGTLQRAVGHIPGTAMPWQRGNVGLAAHRDTFFRGLRDIEANDDILLETPRGTFRYEVESTRIVKPTQVEVLAATESDVLTLVTCYPFGFIGKAPKRFIVRARRVGAPGGPSS